MLEAGLLGLRPNLCFVLHILKSDVKLIARRFLCYSSAGRSVLGKTVPEDLSTKTEVTVFSNTDRPRLVNNIFIFSKTKCRLKKPECDYDKILHKLN